MTQNQIPTQFQNDLESNQKTLFLQIREVLLSYKQMTEIQKSIITTYANDNGPICNMRTMGQQVEITFLKGIKMKDKYKLLSGSGKEMKSITLKEFDEQLLEYYIDQAVEINLKRKK